VGIMDDRNLHLWNNLQTVSRPWGGK